MHVSGVFSLCFISLIFFILQEWKLLLWCELIWNQITKNVERAYQKKNTIVPSRFFTPILYYPSLFSPTSILKRGQTATFRASKFSAREYDLGSWKRRSNNCVREPKQYSEFCVAMVSTLVICKWGFCWIIVSNDPLLANCFSIVLRNRKRPCGHWELERNLKANEQLCCIWCFMLTTSVH